MRKLKDDSIPQSLAELIDLALVDNPQLHLRNAIALKNTLMGLGLFSEITTIKLLIQLHYL